MNFESYLNQAWEDHAIQPERVASEFSSAQFLVETGDQLTQLIGLVIHVMGEHLGYWKKGVLFIQSLQDHPKYAVGSETENAALRAIAVLNTCADRPVNLELFSHSDQIRILAASASALGARDSERAKGLLERGLSRSAIGLDNKDPALRALAVTGNNLASTLEEKANRSIAETKLMILAAQTGRKYWEMAGTWLEVSRAEYRLAATYVKAEELDKALYHAQKCLELCRVNKASEEDMLYSREAIATVERARARVTGFQRG